MSAVSAVDYFARTDTVHIATTVPGGREVVTPIWSVVVDGVPYVRNAYGARSKWYGRVRSADGKAVFLDGERRYAVTLTPLADADADAESGADADVNTRVDEAYSDKYAGMGEALRQVVSPEVRARTLRVTVTPA